MHTCPPPLPRTKLILCTTLRGYMQAVVAKNTPTPRASREMASRHRREVYHGPLTPSPPPCMLGGRYYTKSRQVFYDSTL